MTSLAAVTTGRTEVKILVSFWPEHKQVCATMADSSSCVETIAFPKVSGVLQWVRYRLIEPWSNMKDSALLI